MSTLTDIEKSAKKLIELVDDELGDKFALYDDILESELVFVYKGKNVDIGFLKHYGCKTENSKIIYEINAFGNSFWLVVNRREKAVYFKLQNGKCKNLAFKRRKALYSDFVLKEIITCNPAPFILHSFLILLTATSCTEAKKERENIDPVLVVIKKPNMPFFLQKYTT